MKKFSYLILLFVLLGCTAITAAAESYEIISDWMDLFYSTEQSPWTMKKSEIENMLRPLLQYFDCRNSISSESDHQFICKSKPNAGEGSYQMIFSYGVDNTYVLDAVEIVADHPSLIKEWGKFRDIDRELRLFTLKLKNKTYISQNLEETYTPPTADILHMIMTEGAEYSYLFLFNDTAVSVGHKDGLLILNFCSDEYYTYNSYRIVKDPVTGEIDYELVFPD